MNLWSQGFQNKGCTGCNNGNRLQEFGQKRQEILDSIESPGQHDDGDIEACYILLINEIAIRGDQNIEINFCATK